MDWWSPLLAWMLAFQITKGQHHQHQTLCRSKYGLYHHQEFKIHACAWCYRYISRSKDVVLNRAQHYLVVRSNRTVFPEWSIFIADIDNTTYTSNICRTLSEGACQQWKGCCREAKECCLRQRQTPTGVEGHCPRTWDGFGCWDDSPSHTTVYESCPSFLKYSISSRYAKKECMANGTWYKKRDKNYTKAYEWTDYTKCLDKDSFLVSIYLGLICNVASIALLVPAIAIFFTYRSLRRQHRIRLHINFFAALLFSSAMTALWDMVVTHNRLTSTASETSILLQNGGGCKLLAFLRLYSRGCTYVWMFCEGFYLHRLINNAFKPPKSLLFLYGTGWGIPFLYTMVYGILRLVYANESCWSKSHGQLQWILYTPNLSCLVMNFFFLCNILRILLTRLQSHPNEPSNFRRALKATFVLIPLFGVQMIVTIYRLPAGRAGSTEYERFTVFVLNSQGFFVALIFCFFNGEVVSHVKRTCTRLRVMRMPAEGSRAHTTATSVNFIQHGNESNESENGNLVYRSPRASPLSLKKDYNTMEQNEDKYPYIPLTARKQSPSPTEI